jgi:hypothetical protein
MFHFLVVTKLRSIYGVSNPAFMAFYILTLWYMIYSYCGIVGNVQRVYLCPQKYTCKNGE